MWAGVGPAPQERELACREAEFKGDFPPEFPSEVFASLPEEAQLRVTEAMLRAAQIADGTIVVKEPVPAAVAKESQVFYHVFYHVVYKVFYHVFYHVLFYQVLSSSLNLDNR